MLKAAQIARAEQAMPSGKYRVSCADPLGFVISLNLHRRHLSEGQRGLVAANIANLANGQQASSANLRSMAVTQAQAAEMLNPFRFVWQIHDARRHWVSAVQRQMVWEDAEEHARMWEAERQRIREEANQKRSEAAKAQHEISNPRAGETVSGGGTNGSTTKQKKRHKGRQAKAQAAGTNEGAVRVSDKIKRLAEELGLPEIVKAVKRGDTGKVRSSGTLHGSFARSLWRNGKKRPHASARKPTPSGVRRRRRSMP